MSRRNASRRSSPASKPAWVWFVLGNFVGGFVVFLIFLNGLDPDARTVAKGKAPSQAQQQAEDSNSQPRFDFYTLLQENEVSVPPPKSAKPTRRLSTDTGTSSRGIEPEPAEPVKVEPTQSYILQAASFRDASEAEKLRAQLTLSNLDVKVETATDSRGTWHRVLVGPYQSRSRVAKAREILADNGLMPLVLKRPTQP